MLLQQLPTASKQYFWPLIWFFIHWTSNFNVSARIRTQYFDSRFVYIWKKENSVFLHLVDHSFHCPSWRSTANSSLAMLHVQCTCFWMFLASGIQSGKETDVGRQRLNRALDTTHFHAEDDYRTGCRNVSHCRQQQSYSGLYSPGRSNSTYFWNDSWVQTFHSFKKFLVLKNISLLCTLLAALTRKLVRGKFICIEAGMLTLCILFWCSGGQRQKKPLGNSGKKATSKKLEMKSSTHTHSFISYS